MYKDRKTDNSIPKTLISPVDIGKGDNTEFCYMQPSFNTRLSSPNSYTSPLH